MAIIQSQGPREMVVRLWVTSGRVAVSGVQPENSVSIQEAVAFTRLQCNMAIGVNGHEPFRVPSEHM